MISFVILINNIRTKETIVTLINSLKDIFLYIITIHIHKTSIIYIWVAALDIFIILCSVYLF